MAFCLFLNGLSCFLRIKHSSVFRLSESYHRPNWLHLLSESLCFDSPHSEHPLRVHWMPWSIDWIRQRTLMRRKKPECNHIPISARQDERSTCWPFLPVLFLFNINYCSFHTFCSFTLPTFLLYTPFPAPAHQVAFSHLLWIKCRIGIGQWSEDY